MPTPVPTPAIAPMTLTASGCNGGTALAWSPVSSPAFHRYVVLRSASSAIPASYPPAPGVGELANTKDPSATSAADATGGSAFYRSMALDASGRVIAASAVQGATASAKQGLGALGAFATEPGKTKFSWTPYGGPSACFTWYKLVYSETNPNPSYLGGDPAWAVISDQAADRVVVPGLVSGTTYHVRLQAIRATAIGAFVVAETDVLTYIAP